MAEREGMERKVNQDIPHDWTEWFETGPPVDPYTDWTPEEIAAAKEGSEERRKRIEEYRKNR